MQSALLTAVAVAAEMLLAVGMPEGGAEIDTTIEVVLPDAFAVMVADEPVEAAMAAVTTPDSPTEATAVFDDLKVTNCGSRDSVTPLL